MQVGMFGIGRMGGNLVRRLMLAGHECVVYDVDQDAVAKLAAEGATPAETVSDFTRKLQAPRVGWVMVPAAATGEVLVELARYFQPDDVLIDGGNSMWQDDVDRAKYLDQELIHFLDIGTSGGVYGLERGFSLMIGGPEHVVQRLEPIFDALAPGFDAAPRTEGLTGPARPGEKGWLHCGTHGAGHFVKMVHNGIEYGMMAAIAEGLGILRAADAGLPEKMAILEHDAETTPLRDPEYYQYDINTAAVAEVWRRGSVISSWLGDLTAHAMVSDPQLDAFAGRVSDSGEGRWTVQAAVELGVPAHTITASLYERFASRGNDIFVNKVISAMRASFGGHAEKPAEL